MENKVIDSLKKFNWQKITDYGRSLDELNDAQYRFAKGLAVEFAVEKLADRNIKYVGEAHRDYVWPKFKMSVELKSQFSAKMFDRRNKMKKDFDIKLNNSNGTNKQSKLDSSHVADILIVCRKDGVFVVDKETVLKKAKSQGDGWVLKVAREDVTLIAGPLTQQETFTPGIKNAINEAIKQSIPSI